MYKISGNFDGDLIVYKGNTLFLKVIRLQSWGCTKRGQIFNEEDKLMVEYSHFEFFYTKISILYQDLPLKIRLNRSTLTKYDLNVGDISIRIKFSLTSISKKLCEIYLNKEGVAVVKRNILAFKNEMEIFIEQENEYELYLILLLIMSITTLDA